MLLHTTNFGDIEINDENIISFEEGLPGFESLNRFIIINNEGDNSPFSWLQSVENGDLAFVIMNPLVFLKDYTVTIDDFMVNSLEIEKPEDVMIYSVVVIPEEVSEISANLKAPIIINTKNKKGKQVILDNSEYHVRHYIMEELRKQGV